MPGFEPNFFHIITTYHHTISITIDLRIAIPPLVNYFHHLFPILPADHENSTPLIFLVLAFSLLFLAIPFKIPLTLSITAEPIISMQFRDFGFSGLLGVSLIVSFLFSPSQFLGLYFICMFISPWPNTLLEALKSCLQAIPTIDIMAWNANYITTTNEQQAAIVPVDCLQLELVAAADGDYNNFLADQEYVEVLYGHA